MSAHRATGIDLHLLGVAVRCRSRSGLRVPQEIQRGLPAALAFGLDDDAGSKWLRALLLLERCPVKVVQQARKREKPPGLLLSGFGC